MSSLSWEPGHDDNKCVADTNVAPINHVGSRKHVSRLSHAQFINVLTMSLSLIVLYGIILVDKVGGTVEAIRNTERMVWTLYVSMIYRKSYYKNNSHLYIKLPINCEPRGIAAREQQW